MVEYPFRKLGSSEEIKCTRKRNEEENRHMLEFPRLLRLVLGYP